MAYDLLLALKCATLSKDVYLPSLEFSGEIIDDPNRQFITVDGTQVLMINEPEAIYIVYRGTSYEDIMTDLRFRQEQTHLGGIHRGFKNYVGVSFEQVHKAIVGWSPDRLKPLILTGHSLGAAAAVLAAAFMYANGMNIEAVYTYGSPRVGDADFADYADAAFGERHFRHVNANDGVPRVPWCFGKYRHCGTLKYISVNCKLIDSPSYLHVLLDRWSYFKRTPWKWATDKVIDHSIIRYEVAIQENLPKGL